MTQYPSLSKINVVRVSMENQENELLYEERKTKKFFTTAEFSKSQMEDDTVSTVIQLKKKLIALTTSKKSKRLQGSLDVFARYEKIDPRW